MTTVDNRLQTLWEGCMRNDRKQQELLYKDVSAKNACGLHALC
jgi:hypothetical protein